MSELLGILFLVIIIGGFLAWAYYPEYKNNPKVFLRTLVGLPVGLLVSMFGLRNLNDKIKSWVSSGNKRTNE